MATPSTPEAPSQTVMSVLTRRLASGAPMPTSRELGRILGVSHVTSCRYIRKVRRAHARECQETLHRCIVATGGGVQP
jgi:DNA-binding transcriptional regulator YhcF (GntR family)